MSARAAEAAGLLLWTAKGLSQAEVTTQRETTGIKDELLREMDVSAVFSIGLRLSR